MTLIDYFFFFNDTATTEIYTLSLHDALPISWAALRSALRRPTGVWPRWPRRSGRSGPSCRPRWISRPGPWASWRRSEEHTSELQSRLHLVCRLLLEKKKENTRIKKPHA